jgi:hypothetical protein
MFWNWKVRYFTGGFAPLQDAADAAGAGGGADPSDAGDGLPPSDGGVAADDGGLSTGDADVDDDREVPLDQLLVDDVEDDQARARPLEERMKALQKKNQKLRRQMAKRAGVIERVKGLDLDELIASQRKLADFNAMLSRNPRIRALLNGDAEPTEEKRTPPAEPEEQFDESKLPWDPDLNESNRRLTDMAKESFELKKLVKQLQARLDGNDRQQQQRTEGEVRQVWKSTIESASKHQDGVRDLSRTRWPRPTRIRRFGASTRRSRWSTTTSSG